MNLVELKSYLNKKARKINYGVIWDYNGVEEVARFCNKFIDDISILKETELEFKFLGENHGLIIDNEGNVFYMESQYYEEKDDRYTYIDNIIEFNYEAYEKMMLEIRMKEKHLASVTKLIHNNEYAKRFELPRIFEE